MNRRHLAALSCLPLLVACQAPATPTPATSAASNSPALPTASAPSSPATPTASSARPSSASPMASASSSPATPAATASTPTSPAPATQAVTTACADEVGICLDVPAGYTVERQSGTEPNGVGGVHRTLWVSDAGKHVTSIQTWEQGSALCGAEGGPGAAPTAVVARSERINLTGLLPHAGQEPAGPAWVVQYVYQTPDGWLPVTAVVAEDPAALTTACRAQNSQYQTQAGWQGFIRLASETKDDVGPQEGARAALDGPTHQQAWQVLRTAHRKG